MMTTGFTAQRTGGGPAAGQYKHWRFVFSPKSSLKVCPFVGLGFEMGAPDGQETSHRMEPLGCNSGTLAILFRYRFSERS
jgi:hypothetical protein